MTLQHKDVEGAHRTHNLSLHLCGSPAKCKSSRSCCWSLPKNHKFILFLSSR